MKKSKIEFSNKVNTELKARVDNCYKLKDKITGKVLLGDIPEYFENYGFIQGYAFVIHLIYDMKLINFTKLEWNKLGINDSNTEFKRVEE